VLDTSQFLCFLLHLEECSHLLVHGVGWCWVAWTGGFRVPFDIFPPPAPDTLHQYTWQDISQATRDILTPGTASTFAGGTTLPVTWTTKAGVPFVKRVNVQIRATASGQPTVFVNGVGRAAPAAAGTTVSLNVSGDQGAAFPAVAGWTGIQDMSFTNMSWSDPFDLNFTTSVQYDR